MEVSQLASNANDSFGPRLISIKRAAVILGIGRTLTYELIGLGKLKTVRIGRRRFVPIEAIEIFLEGLSK